MKTFTVHYDKKTFKRERPRKSKQEWRGEQKANEIKLFFKPLKENQYLVDIEEGGKQ